jgi:hypothetical protein
MDAILLQGRVDLLVTRLVLVERGEGAWPK